MELKQLVKSSFYKQKKVFIYKKKNNFERKNNEETEKGCVSSWVFEGEGLSRAACCVDLAHRSCGEDGGSQEALGEIEKDKDIRSIREEACGQVAIKGWIG